jgi:hypothetical protein
VFFCSENVACCADPPSCIVEALRSLGDAAERENNRQVAQFAEKLKLHAQTEEQVLYSAAIVLGDYLRLKLNK